jgi:hypothetical protein
VQQARPAQQATPTQQAAPDKPYYGVKKYPDGDYTGYFSASGKRHGTGMFQFKSGNKYNGSWKNNQMSGTGIYYSVEGWRYEGVFENDQFNGYGKYYNAKGKLIKEGYWKKGKAVD